MSTQLCGLRFRFCGSSRDMMLFVVFYMCQPCRAAVSCIPHPASNAASPARVRLPTQHSPGTPLAACGGARGAGTHENGACCSHHCVVAQGNGLSRPATGGGLAASRAVSWRAAGTRNGCTALITSACGRCTQSGKCRGESGPTVLLRWSHEERGHRARPLAARSRSERLMCSHDLRSANTPSSTEHTCDAL